MRILIVEDDAELRDYLIKAFERDNHEVTSSDTAEKAMPIITNKQDALDFILCDYQLPGADGLAVLSHLKETNASIPFVLMTAHGDLKAAVKALRDGAFEFLVKPFSRQALRQVFERILVMQTGSISGRLEFFEDTLSLTIPATKEAVTSAVNRVYRHFAMVLTHLEQPPRLFESALYQAAMNALTHGSASQSDVIKIRATLDKTAFSLEVEDSGQGFPYQNYASEKFTTLPSLEGKGIPIITSAFLDVSWNDKGNVIVMRQELNT